MGAALGPPRVVQGAFGALMLVVSLGGNLDGLRRHALMAAVVIVGTVLLLNGRDTLPEDRFAALLGPTLTAAMFFSRGLGPVPLVQIGLLLAMSTGLILGSGHPTGELLFTANLVTLGMALCCSLLGRRR